LNVVAEGVENVEQLKFLVACDCAEGQGFFFSKPVEPCECEALIALEERPWARQFSCPALLATK
jgi:EAL domain-containing protein (putative c-di-GMP-specific phosphodiesterase class I)